MMENTARWAEHAASSTKVRGKVSERITAAARLPTGVTLPYVEQGRQGGRAVVLLHGLTDSLRSYEPVLDQLPESLHVFALSMRGHGDAGRPSEGYRPKDFAADVAAFMDSVGLGSAVVLGHSMGAEIAQRFALDFPERTEALVLAGAFASFQNDAGIEALWADVVRLSEPVDPRYAREFQLSTLNHPVPQDFLELVVAESCKVPARVWKAALQGLMFSNVRSERSRITQPTLLVWGSADAMVPRSAQEELLVAIRGARLREYTGAGHALHWEEPARFAADVAAFVRNL